MVEKRRDEAAASESASSNERSAAFRVEATAAGERSSSPVGGRPPLMMVVSFAVVLFSISGRGGVIKSVGETVLMAPMECYGPPTRTKNLWV